ncbi:MAG: hypothetical protein KatS3mg019_1696 [Fimbriimonadales bacterium]|nr:MAG: hypothetical protein KatS3mg019_1696 [Fimbriimonadales bacterium]
MKRVVWVSLLIIGCPTRALSQEVAFPTGWYTYEQVARQLSTQGRTVRCDAALKQEVVLLALKPRSWEQICSLLERGLSIKIERVGPVDSQQWLLKRDPEKARREKQLRERFANFLVHSERSPNPDLSILSSVPLPVLVRETPRLTAMARELQQKIRAAVGDAPPDNMQRTLTATIEALSTYSPPDLSKEIEEAIALQIDVSDEVFRQRFHLPPEWIGDRELKRKMLLLDLALKIDYFRHTLLAEYIYQSSEPQRRIQDAFAFGENYWISPVPVSADAVAWLLGSSHLDASRESLIGFKTSSPIGIVIYRWAGTPGYAGFKASTALVHDDWWMFLDHAYLRITTERLEEVFQTIDEDLYREYIESSQRQHALLSSTVAQRSIPTRSEWFNLYSWVYQWVCHLEQEVIIPLYPHRARCADASNLQKFLTLLPDRGVWRVEQVEGVWIWRNWLEFIDRAPDLPLATLMQLVRSPRTPNDWRRFTRQVSPRQARWMSLMPNLPNTESLFGSSEWLGPLPLVAEQWLLFQVLDAVPQWEHRLKRTRELTIAWRELAPATRQGWGKRLLEVGTGVLPEAFHPWVWLGRGEAFAQWLGQEGTVWVSRSPRGVVVSVRVGDQELLTGVIPLKLEQQ